METRALFFRLKYIALNEGGDQMNKKTLFVIIWNIIVSVIGFILGYIVMKTLKNVLIFYGFLIIWFLMVYFITRLVYKKLDII